MNINKRDIEIKYGDVPMMDSLKWFRGASRYNNGATKYGKKYNLRFIMHRVVDRKLKSMQKLFTNVICSQPFNPSKLPC